MSDIDAGVRERAEKVSVMVADLIAQVQVLRVENERLKARLAKYQSYVKARAMILMAEQEER